MRSKGSSGEKCVGLRQVLKLDFGRAFILGESSLINVIDNKFWRCLAYQRVFMKEDLHISTLGNAGIGEVNKQISFS